MIKLNIQEKQKKGKANQESGIRRNPIPEKLQEKYKQTADKKRIAYNKRLNASKKPYSATMSRDGKSPVDFIHLNNKCPICKKKILLRDDIAIRNKETFHLDCFENLLLNNSKEIRRIKNGR
jgi:hypothetical protein